MTKPTGRPPGRPKGARNRLSREAIDQAKAAGLKLPHEILLAIANGKPAPGSREKPTLAQKIAAAAAAAEYFAPKLSRTEHSGGINVKTYDEALDELDESEGTADSNEAS